MVAKHRIIGDAFRPLRDNVFVIDLDHGPKQTAGGIIVIDDNMTERGIRDRWARVWSVGPLVSEIAPGDWVLVQHGRWTTGIEMVIDGEACLVWRIEFPEAVLLVSDRDPR